MPMLPSPAPRLLLGTFLAMLLASSPAPAAGEPAPLARLSTTSWDLGEVVPGKHYETEVWIESTTGNPVKVKSIARPLMAPISYKLEKDEAGLRHKLKVMLDPTTPSQTDEQWPLTVRVEDPAAPAPPAPAPGNEASGAQPGDGDGRPAEDPNALVIAIHYRVLPPRHQLILVLGEKSARTAASYQAFAELAPGADLGLTLLDLEQPEAYRNFLSLEAGLGRMLNFSEVLLLWLTDPEQVEGVSTTPWSGHGQVEPVVRALAERARADAAALAKEQGQEPPAADAPVEEASLPMAADSVLSVLASLGPQTSGPVITPAAASAPGRRSATVASAQARGVIDAPAGGPAAPRWVWLVAGAALGLALLLLAGSGPNRKVAGRTGSGTAVLIAATLLGWTLTSAPPAALAQAAGPDTAAPAPADEDYAVSVFATGATEGALEVCGCAQGQFGGVSRRAFFLFRVRGEVDRPVVVEAGGWLPPSGEDAGAMGSMGADHALDELARLQARTNLQSLALMEYNAINLGPGDLALGLDELASLASAGKLALVSTDLRAAEGAGPVPWQPYRRHRHGDRSTWIFGISGAPSAGLPAGVRGTAPLVALEDGLARAATDGLDPRDRVVVLSGLSRETNKTLAERFPRVELWVEAAEREPSTEHVGESYIVSSVSKGKAVLRVDLGGQAEDGRVRRIFMGANVEKHPGIDKLLAGFYEQVKAEVTAHPDPKHHREPLFDAELEERWQGYAGSDACKDCHQDQYEQWAASPHAKAYRTLQQVDRYYVPACIQCHTVGYGSETGTGFRLVPEPTPEMEGVGCENCHGPGSLHARRPGRDNIRKKVPLKHCAVCHNPENHPQFQERKLDMLPLVNHTNILRADAADKPLDLYLRDKLAEGAAVEVHLFVMSQCPYGTQAETGFLALKRRFGDRLKIRLHHIARARGLEVQSDPQGKFIPSASQGCSGSHLAEAEDPDAKFSSLHGPSEVAEGIRQVVMERHYPDTFWDYLECRNKNYQSPEWKACALQAGMDPDRIEELAAREGDELFKANIRIALEMNILSSPTILIDNRPYRGGFDPRTLTRLFCGEAQALDPAQRSEGLAACEDVPPCEFDEDCVRPGKVGVCVDPEGETPHCEYRDPVQVHMQVINAEACPTCSTSRVVADTLRMLPGLKVENVPHDSPEGRRLIEAWGLQDLPAYLFGPEIKDSARWSRIEGDMQAGPEGYRLSSSNTDVDYRVGEPWALLEPEAVLLDEHGSPGQTYERDVTLSNAGDGSLELAAPYRIRSFSPSVSGTIAPDSERPGASRIHLRVQAPAEPGPYTYLLAVHTNDPLHPFRLLPIRGMVQVEEDGVREEE